MQFTSGVIRTLQEKISKGRLHPRLLNQKQEFTLNIQVV